MDSRDREMMARDRSAATTNRNSEYSLGCVSFCRVG